MNNIRAVDATPRSSSKESNDVTVTSQSILSMRLSSPEGRGGLEGPAVPRRQPARTRRRQVALQRGVSLPWVVALGIGGHGVLLEPLGDSGPEREQPVLAVRLQSRGQPLERLRQGFAYPKQYMLPVKY